MSVVRKWDDRQPALGTVDRLPGERPSAGVSGLPSIVTPSVLRLFLYVMPIAADE